MSGGSFNYLCFVTDLSELLSKRVALAEMIDALDELDEAEFPGAAAAAARSRALDSSLATWEAHAAAQVRALGLVWKAMEWWRSCDSGPAEVVTALDELIHPPADGDPPRPGWRDAVHAGNVLQTSAMCGATSYGDRVIMLADRPCEVTCVSCVLSVRRGRRV